MSTFRHASSSFWRSSPPSPRFFSNKNRSQDDLFSDMNIRDKLDCIIDIQELKRQEDAANEHPEEVEEEEP
jgi:hypothetical protein